MDTWKFAANIRSIDAPLSVVSSAKVGSYRGGGDFQNAFFPITAADFRVVQCAFARGIPLLNAGACTNLLVPDAGYGGISIHTDRLRGVWTSGTELAAGAGERLPLLAARAAERGMGGLEPLSGIPGTLGGAVVMNAGAFGAEIASLLKSVTFYDWQDGRFQTVNASDIPFGYRTDGGYFRSRTVVAATLRLVSRSPESIREEMRAYAAKRAATQPHAPSLGSAFCRVAGIGAGYYIDRAGLKGLRIGGAAVSDVHAGFIVNLGDGTANDYLQLSALVARTIEVRYGVKLEREYRVARVDADCK